MGTNRSAIIFDLDGTVWDSAPGIVSCLAETMEVFGLEVPDTAQLHSLLGPPLMPMLSMVGITNDDLDAARVEYRRRYRDHGELECAVYPGMQSLIEDLRSRGVPLAVATSKGEEVAVRMLEHFGLAAHFRSVHGASMTAQGHGKVEVVGRALEALGTEVATMIGDRSYDIEGAHAHGLVAVGVGWGYADPGELEAAGAQSIVTTVDELAVVLAER